MIIDELEFLDGSLFLDFGLERGKLSGKRVQEIV